MSKIDEYLENNPETSHLDKFLEGFNGPQPTPTEIIMRGPRGFKGDKGEKGGKGDSVRGEKGKDGKDGLDGKNGKDGKSIKGDTGEAGKDAEEIAPEVLRDKLENLPKGSKLSIQAIDELADILEELKKDRVVKGGIGLLKGGIHAGKGREIRFKDDETPAGTVDGANTDFVLAKTPLINSLKVYRGGARQRITEDYTLSGKTITFLVAPQVGEIILVDYRV